MFQVYGETIEYFFKFVSQSFFQKSYYILPIGEKIHFPRRNSLNTTWYDKELIFHLWSYTRWFFLNKIKLYNLIWLCDDMCFPI